MSLGKLRAVLGRLAGLLGCGSKILFHGACGLMHDDEAGRAFARLHESVRHVARHEQGISGAQMEGLVTGLEFEFTLSDEEPLVAIDMKMKPRSDFCRAEGVEDDAAVVVVLARDLDVKRGIEKFERLIITVGIGFDEERIGFGRGSLRDESGRMELPFADCTGLKPGVNGTRMRLRHTL